MPRPGYGALIRLAAFYGEPDHRIERDFSFSIESILVPSHVGPGKIELGNRRAESAR